MQQWYSDRWGDGKLRTDSRNCECFDETINIGERAQYESEKNALVGTRILQTPPSEPPRSEFRGGAFLAHAGEGRERKSGKGKQGACTTASDANVSADHAVGTPGGVPEDAICCHFSAPLEPTTIT